MVGDFEEDVNRKRAKIHYWMTLGKTKGRCHAVVPHDVVTARMEAQERATSVRVIRGQSRRPWPWGTENSECYYKTSTAHSLEAPPRSPSFARALALPRWPLLSIQAYQVPSNVYQTRLLFDLLIPSPLITARSPTLSFNNRYQNSLPLLPVPSPSTVHMRPSFQRTIISPAHSSSRIATT